MKNILTLLILAAAISSAGYAKNHHVSVEADKPQADTVEVDSLAKYTRLTDDDYRRVAEELGVETATIKAVVEIEAGTAHKGFAAPGIPLINFDLSGEMTAKIILAVVVVILNYFFSKLIIFKKKKAPEQEKAE